MVRSRRLLIALLAVGGAWLAIHGARPPPRLGRAGPVLACDIPVERAGEGVVCLTAAQARATRRHAGDVIDATDSIDAQPRRMAPERLAAWRAPVDVNRASVDELASLDEIGPKLAARIVARRPYVTIDDLARVKGIGERRLARLRDRLSLDE